MLDFQPDCRIFVVGDDGRWHGEFQDFTSCVTSLSVKSSGTAVVTFRNSGDYLVRRRLDRQKTGVWDSREMGWLKDVIGLDMMDEVSQEQRDKSLGLKQEESQTVLYVPQFSPMNLIWIDFKGIDGIWRAGFTGIITSVQDTVSKGTTTELRITCKDLRRLLSLSPIITGGWTSPPPGLEDDPLIKRQLEFNKRQGIAESVQNVLGTLTGPEIIKFVLDRVELLHHKFVDPLDVSSGVDETSFYKKTFWGRWQEPYAGLSNERPEDPVESDYHAGPLAFYYIDPLFQEKSGDIPSVYRQMVLESMPIFHLQTENAMDILTRLSRVTMSDVYLDAKGNLIYVHPRYDDLPRLYARDDRTSLQFHGSEYVIADKNNGGMVSWNLSEDEAPVLTRVKTTALYDFIELGGVLQSLSQVGYGLESEEVQLKFGVREFATQAMFIGGQGQDIDVEILEAYANAVLRKLNTQRNTGSVTLTGRSDLQIGRTLVTLERGWCHYITGVQTNFTRGQGGRMTNTLSLEYGRRIGEKIGNPWDSLFETQLAADQTGVKHINTGDTIAD